MNGSIAAALAIVGGIVTLAIVAVLVSRNAQTPSVISAAGSALSNVIGAAVQPVTGGTNALGGAFGNAAPTGTH